MRLTEGIEEINLIQWDGLMNMSDHASFFQSRSCYEFYLSLSFLKPFVFAISEKDKLQALVVGYVISDGNFIKRQFSKRAIIPGGMLIHPNASHTNITELLNFISFKLKRKSIYIEFRNYSNYGVFKDVFELEGYEYNSHLNFHVDTRSEIVALNNLNKTKRRHIKTSQANGAITTIATSLDEVKDLYFILFKLYSGKIKRPLFPFEFFEKLYLFNKGIFILVKLNQQIIGGSVCVKLVGKTLYEWFVCGDDGKYKGIYPSTLATWGAIQYANFAGLACFDMMGAGKPNEDYGVREFKSKFGGILVEDGRFLKINNMLVYKLGKKYLQLKSIK